ncbi:MAG: MFS transporter [Candidatus Latescibacteria bacterium]|nr:MFS transporter [Candidatus Latescibacterota bacterium]
MIARLRALSPQLLLFIVGTIFMGIASGLFETSFNNFLSDTFHMSASARGRLEFPRELPGFLVAVVAGALFFFSEVHVAVIALVLIAAGLTGLGLFGDQYETMLAGMIIWSTGMHLAMPVTGSISLGLARAGQGATMLGRLSGIRTAASIIGAGLVWLGLGGMQWGYSAIFLTAAASSLVGAIVIAGMRPVKGREGKRPKFLVRRQYRLFYLLNVLFGARKQVFITFGPWVLVKVFGAPVSTLAKLSIVASALGMFFSPQLGRLVDRFGERVVLMGDAVLLMGVCLGYGFAERLPFGSSAVYVIYISYILDQVLFAVGIARTSYLDKLATNKEDVTATLSLGVTIDHAVSMSIPALGGLVWVVYGYEYVFIGAAGVAFLNLIAASFVRVSRPTAIPVAREARAASG